MRTVGERFWSKVNKNGPIPEYKPGLGPCWIWLACRNRGGYGRFDPLAHQFAYELLVKPVPSNKKDRCKNPNNSMYQHYGGRGIKVCQRWQEYSNFLADMGRAPQETSIGRKDNNDYEPGNCWATSDKQVKNKRTNRLFTYEGLQLHLDEWARRCTVVAPKTFKTRIHVLGWTFEKAFTTPPTRKKTGGRRASLY